MRPALDRHSNGHKAPTFLRKTYEVLWEALGPEEQERELLIAFFRSEEGHASTPGAPIFSTDHLRRRA